MLLGMRWLVILCGIALLAFGGSRPASSGAGLALRPAENVPVATLPFEYFRKHILVAIRINDSSPRACMVDNGFNADIITESAARAMGLFSHAMGGKTPNAEGLGKGSGPETFVVEKTVTLGIKDFPILTGQTYVLHLGGFEDGMGAGGRQDCGNQRRTVLNAAFRIVPRNAHGRGYAIRH